MMLPSVVEEFTNDDTYPFKVHLAENDLYDWAPASPTRIYHSNQDELVPVENAQIAYQYFIDNGASNVDIFLGDFGLHADAAVEIVKASYYWVEDLRSTVPLLPGDANVDFSINIRSLLFIF